jgi:RHS repeat-associated protein
MMNKERKNMKRVNRPFFRGGACLVGNALLVSLMLTSAVAADSGSPTSSGGADVVAPTGRVLSGGSGLRGSSHNGETGSLQSAVSSNGLVVTVPNGYANISVDDLRLQSVAGKVRWMRVWDGQEWKFNPHWESLSQSWKNLTGSQSADATGGAPSSSGSGGSGADGCWVWVDEGWQPSVGTVLIGGIPEVGPMLAVRTTPFNRVLGEDGTDYPPPERVSVDYASLCPGASVSGGSVLRDTEGIRRINELYLGEGGRYAFSNRAVLEKRAVRQIPVMSAAALIASLSGGQLSLAPAINAKGFRWLDRSGDWIDYNTQGQVIAYGDRNDNITWLARDTDGVVRGVLDANGRVLTTLHYTGSLLTEIKDYPVAGLSEDLPARSVKYQYDAKNRLTQVTDVRGNVTRYDYDVANRIVKITDPEGRVEQLIYKGDMVKQRVAADGAVTDYEFEYDDTNKQFFSKISGPETAAGRRVEEFTHNRVGKLVRRVLNGRLDEEVRYDTGARIDINTNARGFTTRNTRDEFEQIIEIAHPDGATFKRSYSALHLELIEEIDEAGVKNQYEHDSKGNLLKKIEAVSTLQERVTEYIRNSLGQITQITSKGRIEANGTVTLDANWQLEYDTLGQIKKTTDPEGSVRQYAYDRAGNLVSYTDPRGNVTRYVVDANGSLLKVTDALSQVHLYSYDKVGNLITQTDARSKTTQAAYDAMNRRAQTINPVGGIVKMQYNGQGLPVLETDEDGRASLIEYDNFLRIAKQVDALGNASQFGYEIADGSTAGLLGSLTEPTQVNYPTFIQQTRFDERGRPTSQTLKNNNSQGQMTLTSVTAYDKRGMIVRETDANGNVRTNSYDALGQRIEAVDTLGGKTIFGYDVRGNLHQLIDAKGNVHKFEYDRNNRLVMQTLPLGQITRISYDAGGNVTEKIDPRGNKFVYGYDAANRLTGIKQYKADGMLLRTISQTWDANGNLIAWSDTDATRPSGQQTSNGSATYDDANRKTGESVSYPTPDGSGYTLSYGQAYSPAGKKIRLTWADGTAIDYAYSMHGELETVTIPGEGVISVNQFKWTAPEKTVLPGGVTQNKTFDGLLNLEGFKVKSPGQQTVLDLTNVFGKVQELKSRSRTDISGGISKTFSSSYQYDAETRLTQVGMDSGGLFGVDTETFTFDLLGNRIAHNEQSGAWTYDANNRLIKRGGACGETNTVCYDWDNTGNVIKKTEGARVTQYSYDALNRLVEVKDGQGNLISRYGYDPQDRRLWKEQYRDKIGQILNFAQRSYYLYSDEGLIAEATQAITLNADNGVTMSGAPVITAQYGPRPESGFTTGVLFIKTKNSNGENAFGYYHHDHLQTPIQATDKQGNIVWAATYEPFGKASITTPEATIEKPTIRSNLRLPGQYEDPETGLHYNFRRYYEPETGRYVTEDPVGLASGLNLFTYVLGSPTRWIDPTGENTMVVGGLTGGAIAGPPGAVVGVIVGGIITIITIDWYLTRKVYTCEVRCNVQQIDPCAVCPDRVTGSATGNTKPKACAAAQKDANSRVPRGCYKRHCHEI